MDAIFPTEGKKSNSNIYTQWNEEWHNKKWFFFRTDKTIFLYLDPGKNVVISSNYFSSALQSVYELRDVYITYENNNFYHIG